MVYLVLRYMTNYSVIAKVNIRFNFEYGCDNCIRLIIFMTGVFKKVLIVYFILNRKTTYYLKNDHSIIRH